MCFDNINNSGDNLNATSSSAPICTQNSLAHVKWCLNSSWPVEGQLEAQGMVMLMLVTLGMRQQTCRGHQETKQHAMWTCQKEIKANQINFLH